MTGRKHRHCSTQCLLYASHSEFEQLKRNAQVLCSKDNLVNAVVRKFKGKDDLNKIERSASGKERERMIPLSHLERNTAGLLFAS